MRVLECLDLRSAETVAEVAAWRPDLGLSIDAPRLRAELFDLPGLGTLNVHLGALPEFRGGPPGFWELFASSSDIETCIHWVDSGLETGPVLVALRAPIYPRDGLASLRHRGEELGELALAKAFQRLGTADLPGVPQQNGAHAPRWPTLRQRVLLHVRLAARRWRQIAYPRTWVKAVASATFLWAVRPLRDLWRRLRRAHKVRIFTFHRVSDLCRDGMTVSPRLFDRQLASIARHHDVVDLPRAVELIRTGARLSRPAAAITFDDAYRSVLRYAFPLMRTRGMTGAVFASTDLVSTTRRFQHDETCPVREMLDVMTWEELRALGDAGWEIGGHTATHARLSDCGPDQLRYEVQEPVRSLESRLGIRAPAMSWPFGSRGDITPEALRLIAASGYRACFSSYFGENSKDVNLFEIRRIDLGGDHADLAWKCWMHGFELKSGRRWWAMLGGVSVPKAIS